MNPETVLSLIALVFSMIAFALSFWHTHRSHVAEIRPILVFLYDTERGWHIRNVGSGPGLNVVIVRRRSEEGWHSPVRIPPVSIGDFFQLHWMKHTNVDELGACYQDFEGRNYGSTCKSDLTKVHHGQTLAFASETITAHWKLASSDE